jgi:hypothetical protein
VSDWISGSRVCGQELGIAAFPHGLCALQSSQVNAFDSQFDDMLVVPGCYYAAPTAAFHVEGLQPK